MNDIGKIVGDRIRELRKIKGISQQDLALKASLNASHLSKIELGIKSPTLESLEKIVNALEISFPELFINIKTEKPVTTEKTAIIDKINAKLTTVSYKDQMAIYRLIKMVLWWKYKY